MDFEFCNGHCRTELCSICREVEVPAHDGGLCLVCESNLLECPRDLVEVDDPRDAIPESERIGTGKARQEVGT